MFSLWLDWVLWERSPRWRALTSAQSIWLITAVQLDLDHLTEVLFVRSLHWKFAHFFLSILYSEEGAFLSLLSLKEKSCISSSDCLTGFSISNLLFPVQGTLLLFSCSVLSHSLQPHRLQHTRLPCPSLFPGVCSNSCPLSQWCHPAISSSVVPFSSCLQHLKSWLFASGGWSIGASSSASVLPMNIQGGFPLGLTGLER